MMKSDLQLSVNMSVGCAAYHYGEKLELAQQYVYKVISVLRHNYVILFYILLNHIV